MKTCTRCGKDKPLDNFRVQMHGIKQYRVSRCRGCESAYNSERWRNRHSRTPDPTRPPLPTREELVAWYEAGCPLSGAVA